MSKKPTGHELGAEALLQATFARNLRAARKRRPMTQRDVAERIGVSEFESSAAGWPGPGFA